MLNAIYANDPAGLAKAIAARNAPDTGDDSKSPPAPPGTLSSSATSWGHSYRVTVTALANGRHITRTTVVEPTGDPDRPYLVEAMR